MNSMSVQEMHGLSALRVSPGNVDPCSALMPEPEPELSPITAPYRCRVRAMTSPGPLHEAGGVHDSLTRIRNPSAPKPLLPDSAFTSGETKLAVESVSTQNISRTWPSVPLLPPRCA